MNIQYLNYFLRLAKTRNINTAAADLNMSSQGLMKAVARMEEELGCRLFERTAHGLEALPVHALFPVILLRRDHPPANEPVITREMIAGLPMVPLKPEDPI